MKQESRFAEWVRRMGLRPSVQARRAGEYLERQGQDFLVHFGIDNAIDKAREHWRNRRKPKTRERTKW